MTTSTISAASFILAASIVSWLRSHYASVFTPAVSSAPDIWRTTSSVTSSLSGVLRSWARDTCSARPFPWAGSPCVWSPAGTSQCAARSPAWACSCLPRVWSASALSGSFSTCGTAWWPPPRSSSSAGTCSRCSSSRTAAAPPRNSGIDSWPRAAAPGSSAIRSLSGWLATRPGLVAIRPRVCYGCRIGLRSGGLSFLAISAECSSCP